MRYFLFTILCTFALSSCNSGACIKVGGNYKGAQGDVEYCFSKKKSKANQTPVFVDREGKSIFGLNGEEINKIIEKLKDKMKMKSSTMQIEPILQLRELLDD